MCSLQTRQGAYARAPAALLPGLLLLITVLSAASSQARDSFNQYPFNNDQWLAEAIHFTTWAATLQRHAQQKDQLRCPTEDRTASIKCRGRQRSYTQMINKAQHLSIPEKIELVNFYINRTRYDRDHPQRLYDEHGNRTGVQKNHWATLYEFLTERGDCEDYASAKYFMLRELGIEAADMRIVVAYEQRPRGYHAVLAIRLDRDTVWLLESDNVIKKRNHRGYRYVYAMNEHDVWDHRDD